MCHNISHQGFPVLLTITNTKPPATDLGYLLHKSPARCQTFTLSYGKAHVFYEESSPERCTAVLLLDIDPVALVRGRRRTTVEGPLGQYVNDRPYVASSFLSVAIARVFGSALAGRSDERPELAQMPLPLQARLTVVPCRGGEQLLRRLFEPLGYTLTARRHMLDEEFPHWGESRYLSVEISASVRLCDLLTHLYVLIPVLDDDKHYWVGEAEVDKLIRRGAEWLPVHPERELIANRYLKHQRSLAREALARLADEGSWDEGVVEEVRASEEASLEDRMRVNEARIDAVTAALKQSGARRVLDLGCGEGRLLRALLEDPAFTEIVGMDVSCRSLEIAAERLHLDRLPPRQKERVRLIQGSLMYRDRRLAGYDAAAVVEVIEHLDPPRLGAFESVLFEFARPATIALTTPNAEYNAKFQDLPAGRFRHKDHRFEWTRREFQSWAQQVAERHGYSVRFAPVGPEEATAGAPTQMAIFSRQP